MTVNPTHLDAYAQLSQQHPAFEGFLDGESEDYIACWPVDEIEQLNADYDVASFAPGHTAFASDGGGELFAIAPDGRIVKLAMIGGDAGNAIAVADALQDLFARMRD